MKTMKRFLASMVAVMLLAAMLVIPASAAGEYTITIEGTANGHTYVAYQIFTGDLSDEGVLSNIVWGNGVKGDDLLTKLKAETMYGEGADNQFSSCTTAADVAKVLSAWSPDSAVLDRFAELVGESLDTMAGESTESGPGYSIKNLDAGYYIIFDTKLGEGNENDAFTKYIIRVVRDVEVKPKGTVPSIDKTVHAQMDGTFRKYEDITIGHPAYFKLEGTLPSNYGDYAQYSYKFSDTLPAGLTFKQIETVYILHSSDKTTAIDESAYKVTASAKSQDVSVLFENLKDSLPKLLASDKIIVKYSATLNGSAVVGGTGNVNEAVLHYSNNPNEPADKTNPSTGVTSESSAAVYTYKLDVTKVDGVTTTKVLPGAEFRLYRNMVEDDETTTKLYAQVNNTFGTDDTQKVTGGGILTGSTDDVNDSTILVSDSSGKLSVTGLDATVYYLEEVKAPSGYNKMDEPVRVTITSSFVNDALSELKCDVDGVAGTGNATDGTVSVQVKNNAGATLPSTGGMGTTVLYVAGAAMMTGAAAVLLTKKRGTRK